MEIGYKLRGRVRGDSIPRENIGFLHNTCPPHLRPLSPEYRGEGSGQRNEIGMNEVIGIHQPTPNPSTPSAGERGADDGRETCDQDITRAMLRSQKRAAV